MARVKCDPISFVGQKYGRLEVIEIISRTVEDKYKEVICKCLCGTIKKVRESSLTSGDTTSCGCHARELAALRTKTHGLTHHPLYSVHYGMKKRCYNKRSKDYHHYGGRGITVCDRWLNNEDGLQNFINDMWPEYAEGLELDRKNVDGNYEPDNCRWATRREQVINRRPTNSTFDTKYIEYDGKILCISQWAEYAGISSYVLIDRIGKLGWDFKKAITTKARSKRYFIEVNGVRYKLKEFLNSNGISYENFNNFKVHHTLEECCDKYMYNFTDFKILGEYGGQLVELYTRGIFR